MYKFIILTLLVPAVFTFELPSFITICHKSDPKIGECIYNNYMNVIPKIINGSKELRLPRLTPFRIDEISIAATDSLSLKLTNISLYGLEKSHPENIKVDFHKRKSSLDLILPNARIEALYYIKGKILFLPILGHGPASLEFIEPRFHFEFSWIFHNRKGVEFAEIIDPKLNYTTNGAIYKLDNLFNGDKQLGDQMNKFLNENWKEFSQDVSPAVSETISKIVLSTFNSIAKNVPFKSLWLE